MERMSFEERYQVGDLPWDHGSMDYNLSDVFQGLETRPGKVLDIGCGTGSNSIWLAQQGCAVTGCDMSATAIAMAREKASVAGVDVSFSVADFLVDDLSGGPFDFVFDRGCLHCIDADERGRFAERVARLLNAGGLWLSLIGNADEPPREIGPPRMTAAEVAAVMEPCFEIQLLRAGTFGDKQDDPPWVWVCLMKKRTL